MRIALAVLFVVATAGPASTIEKPSGAAELRERINKVWDERVEIIRNKQIEIGCKAEAKKHYSAIRFKKRRMFVKDCIDQAHR